MGDEKRCKKCKTTIDEGDLCSVCRFKEIRDGSWADPEYRAQKYVQGQDKMREMNDATKKDNLG